MVLEAFEMNDEQRGQTPDVDLFHRVSVVLALGTLPLRLAAHSFGLQKQLETLLLEFFFLRPSLTFQVQKR